MVRSLSALVAGVALCLALSVLSGCESSGTADDAPKGGERRPVKEGGATPPGPDSGGLKGNEDPGTGGGG